MSVMSTIHSLKEQNRWSEVRRWQGRERMILDCPIVIRDYDMYMRGVDRGDQLINLYNAGRRTKKWWKPLFFHELELQLLNSYVLYKSMVNNKEPLLRFKSELVDKLISGRTYRQPVGRPLQVPQDRRLSKAHRHLIKY